MVIKEIEILGRIIKLKHVSESEILEKFSKDGEHRPGSVLAWYSTADKTVYYWSGSDEQVQRESILHEIFHATLDVSGVSQLLTEEMEEALCTMTESWLELFNNKKFVSEMQG